VCVCVCVKFRPVDKSPAQTPYRRQFVFIRHGHPRPRRCAGVGIRGVFNNSGDGSRMRRSQLRSCWHQQRWLCGSMLMTPTRIDACTGGGIKRDSCWKCFSDKHAIRLRKIALFVQEGGQHFNWYIASRRSLNDSWASCMLWWEAGVGFVRNQPTNQPQSDPTNPRLRKELKGSAQDGNSQF